jgi:hypothetical protein
MQTGGGILWNGSEEAGSVRNECEEDEGTECDAVCNVLTQRKLFVPYFMQCLTSILHIFALVYLMMVSGQNMQCTCKTLIEMCSVCCVRLLTCSVSVVNEQGGFPIDCDDGNTDIDR